MTTNTKTNHVQQKAADQSLADGLTKHAQTLPSFLIGSTSTKTTDVIAALQRRITTANTAQSTRATWQTAVVANKNERANTKTLVSGVRQALQLMFAGSIDTLADFGLKPRKAHAAPSPEKKVAAAAKAKATRTARHTMGAKQKAKITGTVSPTAPVTPPTASAPPSTAAAGAPAPVAGATAVNAAARS